MIKRLLVAGIIAFEGTVGASAEALKPESCNLGMDAFTDGTSVLAPFMGCGMAFHGRLSLGENPLAVVTHNGTVVMQTSDIEVSRPDWYQGEYDNVYITFTPVDLPKGETYVFTLTEGSVTLKDDPSVGNEVVSISFNVPDNLNGYVMRVTPKYNSQKRYIGVNMSLCADIVAIGEPQWELRRDTEVIGRYNANVQNQDWNLSTCSVDFPAVTFRPESEYTLVLAAGSFGAKLRPDITNDEISLMLHRAEQGGETETSKSLTLRNCGQGMFEIANGTPFLSPLIAPFYIFEECISIAETPQVTVSCDGVTVARSTGCTVENSVRPTSKQGKLTVDFDNVMLQPGKNYTLHLSAGCLADEDNATIKNEDIDIDFYVPANLGSGTFTVAQGSRLKSAESFSIMWPYETEPVGEPHATLYRSGEKVGDYPASIGWDWNLGQCHIDLGEKMTFDMGVAYSLILPAGSARSCFRDDIVNTESVLNFIGDTPEQSSIEEIEADAVGAVEFYDLNGRRLNAAPAHGLYIERRGNKAAKIVRS